MIRRCALAAVLLASMLAGAQGVQPSEILADPTLEKRARTLSAGLRCLVCQNESIDDSNAPLARDLRLLVRERLQAGDSDQQIIAFLVARYGQYVLLKPPLQAQTILLYATPFLTLLLAGAFLIRRARHRLPAAVGIPEAAASLTDEERARLARLLDGNPMP